MIQSSADLQQLRRNCKNTMHLSAVVLANRCSCQIMDDLTIVCRPMNEAFNLMRTAFKTLKGLADWRRDTSHGAIEKDTIGTWASVCSLANADGVGFILGDEAPCVLPAAVAQDVQLGEVMLQVTCRLSFSSLTSAMTYSHKVPGVSFAPAGKPTPSQSTVALRNMERFGGFAGSVGGSCSRRNVGGRFCSRPHVASLSLRSRGACDVT